MDRIRVGGAQARYQGAVLGDYALRTLLASALTGAMLPGGLLLDGRAEARRLEFYAELAARRDATAVFEPPPVGVPIHSRPGEGLTRRGGHIELLRFRSPFVALNPQMRARYARHHRNMTARAQHWRHEDGARPTLIVIHGFGASPARFNSAFFSLPAFFSEGWDAVLFTLPFHGGRSSPRAPFNGAELFASGLAHLSEAMLQAICDLRVLLDYLIRAGAPRVGVTGLSLGGYVSALLAEVEPRLDFAIPNAAVTSVPDLINEWFPANLGTLLLERVKRVPRELIRRATAIHSPLTYDPVLPRERLMVIGGRGDRLAPPEQSEWLWEHWGRPELYWFPGSHVLHFARGGYLNAMRELMGPAEPATARSLDVSEPPAHRRAQRRGT